MTEYDLAERTKKFSVEVIRVLKKIKSDQLNQNIIFQLLKINFFCLIFMRRARKPLYLNHN